MKFSVVVPIYNVEKYLPLCVDSILKQNLPALEIILVDDASPDGCPQICDRFAEAYPNIVRVIHKPNGGPSAARNAGIDAASGDYILFVDGDDLISGTALPEVCALAEQQQPDIIHNTYLSCGEDSVLTCWHSVNPFPLNRPLAHSELEDYLAHAEHKRFLFYPWRNIYKLSLLKEHGIRFPESLHRIEDSPFNLACFAAANSVLAVDNPYYVYRIREGSLQRTNYVPDYDLIYEQQWELKMEAFERFCGESEVHNEDLAQKNIIDFLPVMLGNIYNNPVPSRYAILCRIGRSSMMRWSFRHYDIRKFKSRSIDWFAVWLLKHRLFGVAHLLYQKVVYKSNKQVK